VSDAEVGGRRSADILEAPEKTGSLLNPKRMSRPVFRWTDLLVPLLCAAAVGADAFYLATADLDSIVQKAVDPSSVWWQTLDHVWISLLVAVFVMAVAVPLGVLITRRPFQWISPGVLAVANAGQAAPSIGLLAIIGIFYIGLWAVIGILTAYSVLPVLRNTIVGLQQVDAGVKDAARGMGMSAAGVLFRVELPLAIPIIGAGARTALVLAVATVAFGDYIGAGGLGGLLFGSIKLGRNEVLVLASLLIAVLALLVDWSAGLIQRALTPRGIR
jgi:osmoprotectant transport system permease protein